MRALVIAHRACQRNAAENSLAGIRLAVSLGADAVEVDVRCTRDGVPVLVHDRLLWRLARRPWPVRLMTYRQVRRLRLRSNGGQIASLSEALAALPDGLVMAIDIKSSRAAYVAAAKVLRLGAGSQVMLWSKKTAALRCCGATAPGVDRALLRDARTRRGVRHFLSDGHALGVQAISAHWAVVTPGLIEAAHERRLLIFSMSRDAGSQEAKIALGLDGVVSDWPAEGRAAAEAVALNHSRLEPKPGHPS